MLAVKKTQGLANAASHLCAAYDELRAAGYESWSTELRMLTEIIDAEIEWLHDQHTTLPIAGP